MMNNSELSELVNALCVMHSGWNDIPQRKAYNDARTTILTYVHRQRLEAELAALTPPTTIVSGNRAKPGVRYCRVGSNDCAIGTASGHLTRDVIPHSGKNNTFQFGDEWREM